MDKYEDMLVGTIDGLAAPDDGSERLRAVQRETQRKFGRNLFRLQQHPRRLKGKGGRAEPPHRRFSMR